MTSPGGIEAGNGAGNGEVANGADAGIATAGAGTATADGAGTAGGSGPPLLNIDSLGVEIDDVQIVKNLTFQVGSGEILGLVGASGSGKSMTALAIMQLLPFRARLSGAVHLRGAALSDMSESQLQRIRGRDIGMVFQEPMTALNPLMRIGDQVAETVRLHGPVPAARARDRAREALDAAGLSGDQSALDRYPYELSGGQRQRVAIAMAVVLRPSLLIADEPTTALDVSAQAQILLLLRGFAHTHRMGLILVSHDLAVIAQVTDRIAVMREGEIVEQGETAETLRHLRHPYARALLAAAERAPKRHSPAIDSSTTVLEVRDIVREYPRKRRSFWRMEPAFRAVDGVSLTVHPGETVGLVGESGSGKSSLLRAILGLDRTQAGEVCLLGERFSTAGGAKRRRLRRSIQAVFQDPYGSFDPQWSVERLIAEPFHLLDAPPTAAERRRRVAAALDQVGLSPADANRYSHEFSGGQRQRIAIARALITEPAMIVFDEAVSALDVLVRAQVLDLLVELSDRLKLAYLFVSHDLNVVRAIADRIYVMQRGRIVEQGTTLTVFASPQQEYTKNLIAATPRLDDPD
jgi:peptide/nickel transport system ATP-binding protein